MRGETNPLPPAPLNYISPSRPTPLCCLAARSFFPLSGYHPCFPLSTLANITRINRRAAKWRGERCGRRRGLSAPITGCLSSPNDSIKTARKRTGQRMDARGFACYFGWRIFFSSANFDMQSISLRTMPRSISCSGVANVDYC